MADDSTVPKRPAEGRNDSVPGVSGTARRKDAHLDLCATGEVEPKENRTLLECVRLVHCAMPELSVTDVETSVDFLGKKLKAPLLITGMTGGTERAGIVNRELASLADQYGVAFGVGSQRAMSEAPELVKTFEVRSVAPNVALIGNIGIVQATKLGKDGVRRLAEAIGADAMALHLNVGQELTQPEGDREFRGGYAVVSELVAAFGDRFIVKETGCGISPSVARRLKDLGVKAIDCSGLGGTSWVRVEQLRANGLQAEVGRSYSEWGIPTAASVASVRSAVGPSMKLVASGGVRTGLDIVKALALGADVGGMALPLFKAQQEGGRAGAEKALQAILVGIAQGLLLTGSRNVAELRKQPKVITGELKDWLQALQ